MILVAVASLVHSRRAFAETDELLEHTAVGQSRQSFALLASCSNWFTIIYTSCMHVSPVLCYGANSMVETIRWTQMYIGGYSDLMRVIYVDILR
jgi:hypothetical protein